MAHKAKLVEWDKKYMWHPFTQMRDWVGMEPLIIERGEGCYLIDTEGNRYIDGVSSLWVLVHGHGKKELVDALQTQADASATPLSWVSRTYRRSIWQRS